MWLVFAWTLLVLPSFCHADKSECFHYSLQNECTGVLFGEVLIEESEQKNFFDANVSLVVSDVRMVQETCRRPFLSYYCQLKFGSFSCESSSLEEQLCLEKEYCIQVSGACSSDFELNCSSFVFSSPSTPTNDCQEKVQKQISQVKETPIAVETCLNNSKEQIECCPDPFISDDNGECVVECYQYLFGETLEKWLSILSCFFSFISLVILGIAVLPQYFMNNLGYPNYIIFLCFGSFPFAYLSLAWATFAGGAHTFVCDGMKDYWKAVDSFDNSTRSSVQFSLWALFVHLAFTHWLLFCFNLFCSSMRSHTTFFEKFIKQPVNPRIIILMEGLCICFSLVLSVTCLTYGLTSNSRHSIPLPIYAFPSETDNQVFNALLDYPLLVETSISAILCVTSVVLYLKRGREIIYFQWRSLLFGFFGVIVAFFTFLYAVTVNSISDSTIVHFMDCVASHPQESPPPCERKFDTGEPFIFLFMFTAILPGAAGMILLWSNSLFCGWWKEMIFSRRALMSKSDYEQIVN